MVWEDKKLANDESPESREGGSNNAIRTAGIILTLITIFGGAVGGVTQYMRREVQYTLETVTQQTNNLSATTRRELDQLIQKICTI
jgi:hypothetical protein